MNSTSEKKKWSLAKTGFVAALTALAAVGTFVIRIPIPATTGYFNIGDVFVILAGLWFGPLAGFIVGAVGPTLADAIGYPQFILATFITKGLEGFVVGIVSGGENKTKMYRRYLGAVLGGLVVIVGYFVFEAFIYPTLGKYIPFFAVTDIGAALIELLPNAVQAIVAIVAGLALWRTINNVSK